MSVRRDGIGSDSIPPSGKIGLGTPPVPESRTFLLRISFMPSFRHGVARRSSSSGCSLTAKSDIRLPRFASNSRSRWSSRSQRARADGRSTSSSPRGRAASVSWPPGRTGPGRRVPRWPSRSWRSAASSRRSQWGNGRDRAVPQRNAWEGAPTRKPAVGRPPTPRPSGPIPVSPARLDWRARRALLARRAANADAPMRPGFSCQAMEARAGAFRAPARARKTTPSTADFVGAAGEPSPCG